MHLVSRRGFIVGVGAGLLLASSPAFADVGVGKTRNDGEVDGLSQTFLHITPDDTVTVFAKHLDMGQGIWSGLSSIIAEELDASWAQMRVVGAPTAPAYKHTRFGAQLTGGSTSISNSFDQLRLAGATARAMLISAAAQRWNVPESAVTISNGVVRSGRHKAGFGALADAAAKQIPPARPTPKRPDQYVYLGKAWPRVDSREKALGQSTYAIDVQLPGMKTAVLAWPPRFGAKVRSFDASAALQVAGVRQVVQTPQGVAVIADDTWSAWKGRRALVVDWDPQTGETRSTTDFAAEYAKALDEAPGVPVKSTGDLAAGFKDAKTLVSADFHLPFLAHASMEPLTSVCQVTADGCEMWAGFQLQTANQKAVAAILGLPIEKVKLNSLLAGGSFGRRASVDSDWIVAAAEIAKAAKSTDPIKLLYTREDDTRAGYYRPMVHHRLRAGLDAAGNIAVVDEAMACQSVFAYGPYGTTEAKKPDQAAYLGCFCDRYSAPVTRLRWMSMKSIVAVQTFRGVSMNATTFVKEVFMDDLARAAGVDPLEYRLRYLKDQPRQMAVLKLAAEKSGWGRPMPQGQALGLAVQAADESFCAQVVEISLTEAGLKVLKVVCAIDCGFVLNPDNVRAQVEGGVGFAISYTLGGEITLKDGGAVQSNFHDYPPLRINDMPAVEVHIVPSDASPTGVGEPGSLPAPAAIANAIARLTGRPIHRLPITQDQWRSAQAPA